MYEPGTEEAAYNDIRYNDTGNNVFLGWARCIFHSTICIGYHDSFIALSTCKVHEKQYQNTWQV